MNILNLPDWDILSVDETPEEVRISAAYKPQPTVCTRCGSIGNLEGGPRKFGSFKQTIRDVPALAKPCSIEIKRQRYQCRDCNQTFSQILPDVDDKRQMTKRLLEWMQVQSIKRTFADVAQMTGVTEATVRNVFHEWVTRLDDIVRFATPSILGIDEMHLLNDMRCILTDVERRTVVGLLETRSKQAVTKHLRTLDRQKVRLVVMDMWQPYRDAVRDVFGDDMIIVIDKFHVVRMASIGVENVRKDLRSSLTPKLRRGLMHDRFILLKRRHQLKDKDRMFLEVWIGKFPTLGLAYELKESFYDIWNATDGQEARRLYAEWKDRLTEELAPSFKDLTRAMENWEREIFAYFDHADSRVTNAYTEAVNGIAKIANRNGRGYSFEAIRAKVLYTKLTHAEIEVREIIEELGFIVSECKSVTRYSSDDVEPVEKFAHGSHGVPISTVKALLTTEDFSPLSTENYG